MATTKRARTKKTTETKAEGPSKPATSVTVTSRSVSLQDAIQQRAYEIYRERGGQHGADLEDWVRAEKEVRERFGARTA